jgi:aldehyde:ferredoxin oxidoreductase
MEIPGYAGNILYVDLTSGQIRKEPLDPELVRAFIGGAGINQRLAYDLIPPHADPFSPENAIIVGAGPFSGTIVPGSSELSITFKLPLSGGIATSCGGGHFPFMLKFSGYDHVVITGRAPKPVYLKIHDDDVALCDAGDLWGMDGWDTIDELRKRHEPCSIIPIGPAGENLVRISVTFMDKGGTVGYGGLPAVMGAKNLKAMVAIQGTREIRVADRLRLQRAVDKMLERVMSYRMRPTLLDGGTYAMTSGWIGGMGLDTVSFAEIHKKSRKTLACPSCPMGDKERIRLTEGEYAPMVAYMTDFMAEWESSGKTTLDNYNRAVYRRDRFNRDGICRINYANVMDMMVALYNQGIITKKDTGGIELTGGPDYDTTLRLIYMISHREGFGDLLAEGGLRAAQKIGHGAEKHLIHIKGCAPFFDPRLDGFHSMAFCQMVHPGRAHYSPGGIGIYVPGRPIDMHIMHARRIGILDEAIERIFGADSYNVGRLTKHALDWYSLFNCVGQCHRLYIHRFHGMESFIEFYSAITGVEVTPTHLLKAGERAWNVYKMLNVRAGFTRKDDQAPEAWFEPIKVGDKEIPMRDYFGHTIITREDTERALDDYYDECGWDRETSAPTPEKLKELGLEAL